MMKTCSSKVSGCQTGGAVILCILGGGSKMGLFTVVGKSNSCSNLSGVVAKELEVSRDSGVNEHGNRGGERQQYFAYFWYLH